VNYSDEHVGAMATVERELARVVSLTVGAGFQDWSGHVQGNRSRRADGRRRVVKYLEGLRREPESAATYLSLADAYLDAGKLMECSLALERGIGCLGHLAAPELHARLGFVRYSLGDTRGALPHLERAVEGISYNQAVTSALANSYLLVDRFEDAAGVWRARVEAVPTDRVAAVMYGIFLKCLEREEEAEKYIEEGVRPTEFSELVCDFIGWVRERRAALRSAVSRRSCGTKGKDLMSWVFPRGALRLRLVGGH
jgi:tetratricopeptide (TPR) repeat protein